MRTNWEAWQQTRAQVEQFLDQVRGDGFEFGSYLPDEQVDAHHSALQHLREIDYLMGRMYVRGQKQETIRQSNPGGAGHE